MYNKVDTNLDFVDREKQIIDFWKKNDVFEASLKQTEGGEEFSFYDGPPTANGKPHIGHILTRVMKDIIPRYKTMKGYHVLRKAGWDTHGLPVELEVEKLLGFDGKQDIEAYGIEPFINKCKESVWKYKGEWEKMSDRVGYWVDMESPYITYDDNYIESVWWALAQIEKKGLLYKGHKIVPYCPRCGTALSSHEVAQGYKDVTETSCIANFKVTSQENTYILAWTTTPWTLPSNVAVCFNPEYDYSTILADGKKYILATELISKHFKEYEILSTKKGKTFEGLKYEPLFSYYNAKPNECYYVTCDNYVTLTDGTGVVHIAPAFGEDDASVGKKYKLPFVQMVDDRGKFIAAATDFVGMFVKDADKPILAHLKAKGLLFSEIPFTHSYPFCWRCDTPLLYYARSSWFIKVTDVKKQLIKNNNSVNWMPENIKSGRMGNFLENVIDWGISRERYWGTPLPFWICDKCGKRHVIGSKAELQKLGKINGEIELHKPYVDEITFPCDCGGTYKRTPEVLDCWFDSGSMPFAQYHYPFENKELFESTFPANFISEAIDQTRGWFYTLLAISTLLFDKAPFKNCIVLGHVNDKNGVKMSKHKGNVVDPWSVLDNQGADAVRWYFYTNSSPWMPSRFYPEAVSEAQRKFLGTLWNTYSFYILYAEIDKFDPMNCKVKNAKFSIMDKWILSKLNSLTKFVDSNLDEYKITESAREIADFTDELSNWYVRRCRDRFWASEMNGDKIAAYFTLYTVLDTLVRLSAPFTPFMAESIYQNINRSVSEHAPVSVHLCAFPKCDKKLVDLSLEKNMQIVQNACMLGRACRNDAKVKNRQPLSKIMIAGEGENLTRELKEVLQDELNVKAVEIIKGSDGYIAYEVKPQLKTLGARYGKNVPKIKEYLASNGDAAVAATKNGGDYNFTLEDGTAISLKTEDLLITVVSKQGYASQADKGVTIILDINLTQELIEEGIYREVISKIQTMRKETEGMQVTDRITIVYSGAAELVRVVQKFAKSITTVTLASSLTNAENSGKVWDINGLECKIEISKQ